MTLTLMLPESPEEWFRQLPTRPLAELAHDPEPPEISGRGVNTLGDTGSQAALEFRMAKAAGLSKPWRPSAQPSSSTLPCPPLRGCCLRGSSACL
jgi:hypothetical protein